MSQSRELSKEEMILRAMKMTLLGVARDTATEPGLKHPLTEQTIIDIRECLRLISAREYELAQAAGERWDERPHFTDERRPAPQGEVVVPITAIGRNTKKQDT